MHVPEIWHLLFTISLEMIVATFLFAFYRTLRRRSGMDKLTFVALCLSLILNTYIILLNLSDVFGSVWTWTTAIEALALIVVLSLVISNVIDRSLRKFSWWIR